MIKETVLIAALFLAACTSNTPTGTFAGEKFEISNPVTSTELTTSMGAKAEIETQVSGTILEVCKKKGCWMTLPLADGKEMRVTFKDYGFFVPLDCAGKQVILKGRAYLETTSVADQQHYAEDAGKSAAEIAAITAPIQEVAFEATGVFISK